MAQDPDTARRGSVSSSGSWMTMPAMPTLPSMAWMYGSSPSAAEKESSSPGAAQQPRSSRAKESPTAAKRRPSQMQQLREGYESLVCAVVRPPRSRYSVKHDLGPRLLKLDSGINVARQDFAIPNYEGKVLQGSIWRCATEKNKSASAGEEATAASAENEGDEGEYAQENATSTAVIYLHGNSSCRVDATRTGVLETVAPLGAVLVAFDFSGSGLSDGEYVTLGWHEHHDVASVVEYLHLEHGINRVALWGRSMGAVSALLFAQAPLYALIRPDALVLDSPFCSFPRLVDDLIKKGALRIPRIAVKTVLSMVRSSVKKRTGADVYKLEPIKGCSSAAMPALFVTADHDEMIPVEHGAAMNEQWSGPSMQVSFRGGHNSPRPPHIYDAAGTFLRAVFEAPPMVSGGNGSDGGGGSGGGGGSSGGTDEAATEASAVAAAFVEIQGLCDGVGGDLPPGWLSAVDPESGDTYYYDTFTHKTTWFKPKKPSVGIASAAESSAEGPKDASSAADSRAAEDEAASDTDDTTGALRNQDAASSNGRGAADDQPSTAGLSRGKGEFGAFAGFSQHGGNLSDLDEFEEAYGGEEEDYGEEEEEEVIEFGRSSSQHDALLSEPVTAAALSHLAQAGANAGRVGSAAAQVESDDDEEISLTNHGPSSGGRDHKEIPHRNAGEVYPGEEVTDTNDAARVNLSLF